MGSIALHAAEKLKKSDWTHAHALLGTDSAWFGEWQDLRNDNQHGGVRAFDRTEHAVMRDSTWKFLMAAAAHLLAPARSGSSV